MTSLRGEAASGPLQQLRELLGDDAFFVPCEWGTKKPLVTYVERPFEATKSEAYRALLTSPFIWGRHQAASAQLILIVMKT